MSNCVKCNLVELFGDSQYIQRGVFGDSQCIQRGVFGDSRYTTKKVLKSQCKLQLVEISAFYSSSDNT